MPGPYCYEYPRPAVTVDLVVFARAGERDHVLLIRRGQSPFAGQWALPGGFLEMEETVEDAASRELREETGLEIACPISFLGCWSAPGRDPRGRTISLVFVALLPGDPPRVRGQDDAEEAAWLEPARIEKLAFDHDSILESALAWLEGARRN